MSTQEVLLTQAEVAKWLQIQPKTVGDYLRCGKLRGIKIGRLWRIQEAEVKRFLVEAAVGTTR